MGEDCPEFLKPRLRIFLSADIIGSTALKQSRLGAFASNKKAEASWFSTIQGFYFEAQQHLKAEWTELSNAFDAPECFGDPPEIWKTIGDEVLFTKVLTDHRQVATTLQCWQKTLEKIRKFLFRDGLSLGVKSTAWLAGFPFRNKEVVLSGDSFSQDDAIENYYAENGRILNDYYENSRDDVNVDYIGPSIDTGFRLTSLSSSRKLIVSVDIAYILAITSPTKNGPIDNIRMRYDGQSQFKGVFGGGGYPIFWLDQAPEDSAAVLEDRLTGDEACDRDHAQEFCEAFFAENSDFIFPPFISSDSEIVLTERPEWYDRKHANLVASFLDTQVEQPEPDPEKTNTNPEQFKSNLSAFLKALDQFAEKSNEQTRPSLSERRDQSEKAVVRRNPAQRKKTQRKKPPEDKN